MRRRSEAQWRQYWKDWREQYEFWKALRAALDLPEYVRESHGSECRAEGNCGPNE